ncbi:DUF2891 domain-containing protein [Falsiroseomonas tokyonensis]|uniref:DUF2891 domain-containing protein n=1 Tax=Falsiroseomonas tokyonensis TaxID=430521 RepID=A0ABV7BUQ0_9PROT|nr:DUF2891 domain-containing protein [Falsiroseomonas tokyonensis]MBU8538216.1 DUF2891 domain-containing protein [Falsiroseomonas tokyonensis]
MPDPGLEPLQAQDLALIALGHVGQEWPQKLDHVLTGPMDLLRPALLHPMFHGSFDWHSCVHAHWLLARLLKLFPDLPAAPAIRARFDAAFTAENTAAERAYLARPSARGFERPYGWAWLLKLHAELVGTPWHAVLAPLAADFAARFRDHLPRADYPIRAGVHGNTAFALLLAADWAEAQDPALLALLQDTAWRWYGADTDCQAWEPSGEDFLSPALVEAACMARLLGPARFGPWRDAFLPRLAARQPASLFTPARVSDRQDGRIVHLDGLNLSRAWCLRRLLATLPEGDPRTEVLRAAAEAHLAASLPHLEDSYMGAHWLASFALLALEN